MSLIRTELEKSVYDDYDRLVQLCDSIAGAEGVLDIEERMLDVKRRYGFYPQKKWDAHIGLRRYFEEKMGRDVYEVCEKETYDPKSAERTTAVGKNSPTGDKKFFRDNLCV